MYHAAGGSMHLVSHALHARYGPVVRMAPNYLDLDYPSLISTCLDSHGVWKKVRSVHPTVSHIVLEILFVKRVNQTLVSGTNSSTRQNGTAYQASSWVTKFYITFSASATRPSMHRSRNQLRSISLLRASASWSRTSTTCWHSLSSS